MFWYPAKQGYVNLENAVSIGVEKTDSEFSLVAYFSSDKKEKIILKTFQTEEEASQLLDWVIRESGKR